MAIESIPDSAALRQAFNHEIYSSAGTRVQFGSLFKSKTADDESRPTEPRVLVVFIRHFFCGNCQEYVRRLSSPQSPFHPSKKRAVLSGAHSRTGSSHPTMRSPPTVLLIGPGLPSLIPSYVELTQCPYPVYADPSTRLYEILGMHRTLSLGSKAPGYIQHSLLNGAIKSAWQVVKRLGSGDALSGGDWNVNGGEFLFVRRNQGSRPILPSRRTTGRTASSARAGWGSGSDIDVAGWEVHWCHRMLNSRDHTELLDLQHNTSSSISFSDGNAGLNPLPHPNLVDRKPLAELTPNANSYSHNCGGPCPGPDIPRSREEVLLNHALSDTQPRLHGRSRSRSKSSSSYRAEPAPVASRAKVISQSESRTSTFTTPGKQPQVRPSSPIEEEDGLQSRKSFTASVVDRVGLLARAKSVSSKSAKSVAERSVGVILRRGRTSLGRSRPRPHSRAASRSDIPPVSSSRPRASAPSPSRSDCPSTERPKSCPQHQTQRRARTFSFPKPNLNKGAVKIDDNGVMMVDGVEFVNVISIKARIGRVDSGYGQVDTDPLAR